MKIKFTENGKYSYRRHLGLFALRAISQEQGGSWLFGLDGVSFEKEILGM